MNTWIVSRHPGALEWLREQNVVATRVVAHLSTSEVERGDVVVGTLPVSMAAEVCALGTRYIHLRVDMPAEARGTELTAEQLNAFHAVLEEYTIHRKALALTRAPMENK